MSISWGSSQGWKISPMIVGTSRVVDSNESPAFSAVRRTCSFLRSVSFKDSSYRIRALETTLRDLFEGHSASPLDADCDGNTLLYEVLRLVCMHDLADVDDDVDSTAPACLSLIRYLLDSGANPNILRSPDKTDLFIKSGGTALDMYSWAFVSSSHRQTRTRIGHATYLQLVKDGGHFTRTIDGPERKHPVRWFQHFEAEYRIFQSFGEQDEVHGFTELIRATIQQSEDDFQREISKSNINHSSPHNGLSAIHFAIYWPLGLRRLIDAGANVNCQDRHGRRPVHLAVACGQTEAVEILLKANCSLFTPDYSFSLLQESLRNGRDFDQTTILIIDALIDRHTRLVNLALSNLPDDCDLKQKLTEGVICEMRATQISQELSSHNYHVPAALELDRDGEGVYDTAEVDADIRLTTFLAERLWRGGFCRINDCSPLNGLTPILQSWYGADFEMVSWFISKGVSPFGMHRDAPISGLHLYAARLSYPGAYFQRQASAVDTSPQHISQLVQNPKCCHDSCSCLCSVGGCSALSTLVKQTCIILRPRCSFDYETIKSHSQVWCDKLLYLPGQHAHHMEQLLRALVFERSGLRHTCCRIDPPGHVSRWNRPISKGKLQCAAKKSPHRQQEVLERDLERCRDRMSRCECATLWKPVCAAFLEQCKEAGATREI